MPKHRELPVIPESLRDLKGHIVLFICASVTHDTLYEVVLSVTDVQPWVLPHKEAPNPETPSGINILGSFIAGDFKRDDNFALPYFVVKDYRIVERSKLPLLIGYKYTSSLLAELIKG